MTPQACKVRISLFFGGFIYFSLISTFNKMSRVSLAIFTVWVTPGNKARQVWGSGFRVVPRWKS
jgi:hypothetical protein